MAPTSNINCDKVITQGCHKVSVKVGGLGSADMDSCKLL